MLVLVISSSSEQPLMGIEASIPLDVCSAENHKEEYVLLILTV